jgi:hypothetical protein
VAIQHFSADGVYLGRRQIPTRAMSLDGTLRLVSSIAMFCPKCGEIWGNLHHDIEGVYWQVRTTPCRKHGDGRLGCYPWPEPAGLQLYFNPERVTVDWPEDALRRELVVTTVALEAGPTGLFGTPIPPVLRQDFHPTTH